MRQKQNNNFVVSAIGAALAALSTAGTVAALGTAASVAGTAGSLVAQRRQAEAASDAAAASRRAEMIRKQQMEEESRRKQLATLRQNIINIGRANSNVELSGVAPGSSAAGSAGGANATFSTDLSGIRTGESFGSQLFAANAQYSEARGQAEYYGGLGNMFMDLGAAAGPLMKTGVSLFNRPGVTSDTNEEAF